MRHRIICSVLTMSCLLTLASCDVTLGPKMKTEIVLVQAGDPIEILQNAKVKGRSIKTGGQAEQEIGGWVAMPKAHFEALERALKASVKPREKPAAD